MTCMWRLLHVHVILLLHVRKLLITALAKYMLQCLKPPSNFIHLKFQKNYKRPISMYVYTAVRVSVYV